MKKIIVACGTGVATSAAVLAKIADLLDTNGFAGTYELQQASIKDAPAASASADLLIATVAKPDGIACPYISGIPFLTNIGKDKVSNDLLRFMAE